MKKLFAFFAVLSSLAFGQVPSFPTPNTQAITEVISTSTLTAGFTVGASNTITNNGTISNTGTISGSGAFDLHLGTVTLPYIANNSIYANIAGSSAAPIANTLTAVIDAALGSTRGAILERGSSGWTALAPGSTSGYVLTSAGTGADPTWSAVPAAGSNTQIQYNSSGALAGTSLLTWNGTGVAVTSSTAAITAEFSGTNSSSTGYAQCLLTNDSSATLSFGMTGSAYATTSTLQNTGLIGSTKALILMTDGGSLSGGTDTLQIRIGGYGSTQEVARFVAHGLLVLGTTDNSNGAIQIASNTTATTGLAFGNDTPQATIYRSAASTLTTPANWVFNGSAQFTPAARTSGSAAYFQLSIPADTAQATTVESPGFRTVTASRQWTAGTVPLQRENLFAAPTYTQTAAGTFTEAATLAISGAVISGTNSSITTDDAVLIQAGAVNGAGTAPVTTNSLKILNQTGGSSHNYAIQIGTNGAGITNIHFGTTSAMTAGAITVADTATTANSRIFAWTHTLGTITVPASYYISARSAGTSFTITSSQATDTSTVDYVVIEP